MELPLMQLRAERPFLLGVFFYCTCQVSSISKKGKRMSFYLDVLHGYLCHRLIHLMADFVACFKATQSINYVRAFISSEVSLPFDFQLEMVANKSISVGKCRIRNCWSKI